MNRTEYENTLHDLLGISVGLKELLPEDATVAGFDNVGAGLGISASHLVRYQRAADKAHRGGAGPARRAAAWTGSPAATYRERWFPHGPGGHSKSELHLHLLRAGGGRRVSSSISSTESNGFLEMEFGTAVETGNLSTACEGLRPQHRTATPLPVLFFRVGIPREFNVDNARVIAVRDAPANEPTVIEEEIVVTDDPHARCGKTHRHQRLVAAGAEASGRDWKRTSPPERIRISAVPAWRSIGSKWKVRCRTTRGYRLLFGDLPRGEQRRTDFRTSRQADAARLIPAFLSPLSGVRSIRQRRRHSWRSPRIGSSAAIRSRMR